MTENSMPRDDRLRHEGVMMAARRYLKYLKAEGIYEPVLSLQMKNVFGKLLGMDELGRLIAEVYGL